MKSSIFILLSLFFYSSFSKSSAFDDIRTREEITSLKYYEYRLTQKNQAPRPRKEHKPKSNFDSSNWLKSVDGNKKIFSLSIPGTHESCARVGGPLVQCQDWSIEEQLNNGVRYLDIRCRHINDCFMIHHGSVYQQLSFGTGVRDVCINFLKAHPTEFIFMQIKEEYEAVENTRSFEETMKTYINSLEQFYFLDEISPTLDQVRGKIVILRRFSSTINPMGNYLQFQDNTIFTSTTTITARIQDCYNVPTLFDRGNKWNHVLSLLNEALINTDNNKLFVNFGSGSSAFCYPWSVCDYITPLIGNYLEHAQPNAFVGVIMFDYINSNYNNLVEILVRRNY
ncbi:hypothetical protein M9Y10_019677 [Tritrichomonas musculus]|uniref:Phosphatidylinositol-specific phospholipase C X domain-containing protein n=1 Tax=Tritrichomonas musculus TaxID=1915356 RepID=A0ABR2HJ28_9EUKA